MKNRYHSKLADSAFDAIVIGSGIGGLTTAVFLAKAGKKVLVLEKHYEPGGLSHTFKRKNFVWDVGVHYVGQVHKKESLLRKAFDYVTDDRLHWAEMGEVYDKAIIDGDEYEFVAGREAQLQKMISYFPEEEQAIRNYYALIKKASSSSVVYFSEKTMPRWLSNTVGHFMRKSFYRYSDVTTYEVLKSLTSNEKLISVWCTQYGNYGLPPKKSSFAIHAMIVDHFIEGGNYPVGGASMIHETMTQTLEENGGTLAIKAAVKNIVIEHNKAIGVELENGDIIYGKKIISNAGADNTFNCLINHNGIHAEFATKLNVIKPSISHVCLYIGLNKSDDELKLPKHNIWLYRKYDFDYQFDSHLSHKQDETPVVYISFPSAKDPEWAASHPDTSTIQVVGSLPYDLVRKWENDPWQKRGKEYEELKESLQKFLLESALNVLPQIKDSIAYMELSTPLSTKHFTSYRNGEIYGLEHTPKRFQLNFLRPQTKIKNLYLTGQDVVSVGVGAVLFSGMMTAIAVLNRNLMWKVLRRRKTTQER